MNNFPLHAAQPMPRTKFKKRPPPPPQLHLVITYQSSLWLDQRPVLAIHLVVETAGVAEVVSVSVTTPQRG